MSMTTYELYEFIKSKFQLPMDGTGLHLDISAPPGGEITVQATLVEAAVKVVESLAVDAEKAVVTEVEAVADTVQADAVVAEQVVQADVAPIEAKAESFFDKVKDEAVKVENFLTSAYSEDTPAK